MIMRTIRAWLRDRRGVAAVEFAFVLPIIAGMTLASYGVWDAAARNQDLRSALKVGTEYYMAGGGDDADARAVTLASWNHRPDDAAVTSERMCRCGSSTISCSTTLCADSKPPAIYVTLQASSTDQTALFSPSATASRTIRVR
jgi:Flp pilus assembly protein TadG